MITIEYTPYGRKGVSVADSDAEEFVLSLIDTKEKSAIVNTANVIHAARALSLEKGFKVQFVFGNKTITPNEYGALNDWPKGFCDSVNNWIERVLRFAINKRKAEKDKE